MGNNHYEKDYDDEVYEDDYYDEHYNEEELKDDSDDSDDGDDGDKNEDEKKMVMSFACEECDYRWEDQIVKSKNVFDEDDDPEVACPMCGSMNVTQIWALKINLNYLKKIGYFFKPHDIAIKHIVGVKNFYITIKIN